MMVFILEGLDFVEDIVLVHVMKGEEEIDVVAILLAGKHVQRQKEPSVLLSEQPQRDAAFSYSYACTFWTVNPFSLQPKG